MARPLFNTPSMLMAPFGSGSVIIGAAAPLNPIPGQLWWRPTDGNLYIYYDDGTSQQWVPAMATAGGPP
jgi:hypothetical protein